MRIGRSSKGKERLFGRSQGKKEPGRRQLRVGEALRHALSECLSRGELHDPDLIDIPITVTEVSVSPDLKNATAYVIPLGGKAIDTVIPALQRAAPFLRTLLAKEVDLRVAPHLTIALDTAFESASRIEAAIRKPTVARDLGHNSTDKDRRNKDQKDGT